MLISFVAVVLTLLSVTTLTVKNGASPSADVLASVQGDARHSVGTRPGSTASPASHRSSVQTAERRASAAALGQSADIHYPGGSPDVPVALTSLGRYLPTDLVDLPVDASAQVIATKVSVAHRGRAPPAAPAV